MKLVAKISDVDLLMKSMHKLGTAFYHLCGDDIVEVVYFSGNRIVYFKGKMSSRDLGNVRAHAYPAKRIEIDEEAWVIKVEQKGVH